MFPTIQLVQRPGIIELGWGHPNAALLPVAEMQRAAVSALEKAATDALSYGADQGAGPLLAWLRERIRRDEGNTLEPDQIAITGGASDALDQVCTLWTRPGDTVLVEAPTYYLALRILRDHGLQIVSIPTYPDGLRVDELAATITELRRAGRSPRLLYTIPTFHNPTGVNLSDERRRALVSLAAAEELLIVEDDVYRELSYDGSAPASLWSLAPSGTVMRLGSFAKSLAPGLRLGWITASAAQVGTIVGSGLRDSGGGVNHFAAMIVANFCAAGAFESQVARFRSAYRTQRDALVAGLHEYVAPHGATWTTPGGGFFVWLKLPEGMDAAALRSRAEAGGVSFSPGAPFFAQGGGMRHLRLSFSLYSPDELYEGARRLGNAMR